MPNPCAGSGWHGTVVVMSTANHSDLIVVGSGIVGLGHAVEAVRRGLTVTVVEREDRVVGASVRNFGHGCVTAQAGVALDLARVTRERWLELGRDAGFWVGTTGTVVVARADDELALLQEFADSRPGEVGLLDAVGAAARVGSAATDIVGGAFLDRDLRVDPRTAAPAIAGWLAAQPGVTFRWSTNVLGVESGRVRTSRGDLTADQVVVCLGHDVDHLFPDLAEAAGVRRCRLHMLRVEAPEGRTITPAVLTGLSMLRYPGLAAQPSAARVRARFAAEQPELLDLQINLMLTQRPDGDLLIGDTHEHVTSVDPFSDEGEDQLLLDQSAALLGVPHLRVKERWMGVYASAPEEFLVVQPYPGATVVSVTSGIGMTTGLGLASHVLGQLLEGVVPAVPSRTPSPDPNRITTMNNQPQTSRIRKRQTLTALAITALLALLLTACGDDTSADEASATCPNGKIRFGVEPYEDPAKLTPAYQAVAEALSDKLDCPVEVTIVEDYSAEVLAMQNGQLEIAQYGPLGFVFASKIAGAEPLVSFGTADGELSSYTAGIWVPKESDLQSVDDLTGRTLALGGIGSTSGDALPREALKQAGIAESDLKIEYAGGHPEALLALVNGKVDAAQINSQTLATATAEGTLDVAAYRQIWTSEPIPNDPITVRSDLSQEFKDALLDALLTLSPEVVGEVGTFLDVTPPGPMIEVTEDTYAPLFQLAEDLGLTEDDV